MVIYFFPFLGRDSRRNKVLVQRQYRPSNEATASNIGGDHCLTKSSLQEIGNRLLLITFSLFLQSPRGNEFHLHLRRVKNSKSASIIYPSLATRTSITLLGESSGSSGGQTGIFLKIAIKICANVWSGVTQGSWLGSILFNVYIKPLLKKLKVVAFAYADDIVYAGNIVISTKEQIQQDFDIVGDWLEVMLMLLLIFKCLMLHCGANNPLWV